MLRPPDAALCDGIATKLDLIESGFIYTSPLGYFGATAASDEHSA
jgi:hypothetical protein